MVIPEEFFGLPCPRSSASNGVRDTKIGIGSYTDVEMMLMIRPYPASFIPLNKVCVSDVLRERDFRRQR